MALLTRVKELSRLIGDKLTACEMELYKTSLIISELKANEREMEKIIMNLAENIKINKLEGKVISRAQVFESLRKTAVIEQSILCMKTEKNALTEQRIEHERTYHQLKQNLYKLLKAQRKYEYLTERLKIKKRKVLNLSDENEQEEIYYGKQNH